MADRKQKRRRSGVVEFTNALLTLLVIGLVVFGGLFLFLTSQFYAPGQIKAETSFFVEPNDGLGLVAQRLESQELISNQWIFRAGGWVLERQSNLRPGEFVIPANASMSDILTILTEGKPVEYFVTVPEGETSWGVIQRIAQAQGNLTGDLPAQPPEGTILPGRYDFMPRDSKQSVLDQMTAAMTAQLPEIWESCRPDVCGPEGVVATPEEFVTLASIVEKETGVADERPRVAAVFVNRLKRGMRLQSDPTIIYGVTNGQGPLGRPIRKSEIEARTPYNTYQIDGLPQGPIANPGIESLRAVANPAQTEDLYFVAAGATPDQGHLFATSYADHRRNVAQYRAAVAAAQAEAEAAEAEAAKAALEAQEAAEAGEIVAEEDAPAAGTEGGNDAADGDSAPQ
jgi:UPF0755 protein